MCADVQGSTYCPLPTCLIARIPSLHISSLVQHDWATYPPHPSAHLANCTHHYHASRSSPSRLAALSSTLVVGMPPTVATAAAALSPGPPSHSSLPEATLFSPGRSFEAFAALASFSGLVRRRPCMLSRCSSTSCFHAVQEWRS